MNSFFLWHAEEQKLWNNDNGAHYFFTSEQEQKPNVSHLLLPFGVLAWECAGSASMLHSSLLEKEDGDLNAASARCPPCCRNNTRGCRAFNKSHPVSFLCLADTGEMLDPLKPTVMTHPAFPHRGQMASHSETNTGKIMMFKQVMLSFFSWQIERWKFLDLLWVHFIFLFMYLNSYERDNLTA